jgi:hypothetical protein
MVTAAMGAVLWLGGCGSDGPGDEAPASDPANVVRANDFDQGYLSGQLGAVRVAGEATVRVESWDDDCDGCEYTNVVVQTARPDGSWGMTILDIDGGLAGLADGEATVYVTGCSGPEPDVMDWDVPADEVETDAQPDPTDASSTIVSIESTFSEDYDGTDERETWWGGSEEPFDGVTTLLRLPR